MAKVVFTQKPDSINDDLPEEHYHFPKTYRNQVRQGIGDWVIYYRPRRGSQAIGLQPASSYFAVVKLVGIQPDLNSPELIYAQGTDYLEFDASVSFRCDDGSYEATLLKSDGSINKGAFGRSVRLLFDDAFETILKAGFASGTRHWETISDYPVPSDPIKRCRAVCELWESGCSIFDHCFHENDYPFDFWKRMSISERVLFIIY